MSPVEFIGCKRVANAICLFKLMSRSQKITIKLAILFVLGNIIERSTLSKLSLNCLALVS